MNHGLVVQKELISFHRSAGRFGRPRLGRQSDLELRRLRSNDGVFCLPRVESIGRTMPRCPRVWVIVLRSGDCSLLRNCIEEHADCFELALDQLR